MAIAIIEIIFIIVWGAALLIPAFTNTKGE